MGWQAPPLLATGSRSPETALETTFPLVGTDGTLRFLVWRRKGRKSCGERDLGHEAADGDLN